MIRSMQTFQLKNFDTLQDYQATWQAMREFTDQRDANSQDEIWLLEHSAVFTQGQAGKAEHVLNPHDISVVQSDRGGQVTYHGPGQLIAYCLFDLRRLGIGIKSLVVNTENAIIQLLNDYDIDAHLQKGAPGVYVDNKKIASLGFRVRKGCSYHGLSLNVDMDLTPFSYINPCGFENMQMTQMSGFQKTVDMSKIKQQLKQVMRERF